MSKRILNAGFSVKAFDVDFQRVRAAGLPAVSSLSELTLGSVRFHNDSR